MHNEANCYGNVVVNGITEATSMKEYGAWYA